VDRIATARNVDTANNNDRAKTCGSEKIKVKRLTKSENKAKAEVIAKSEKRYENAS